MCQVWVCRNAGNGAQVAPRESGARAAYDRPLVRTYRRDLSGHSPVGCDTCGKLTNQATGNRRLCPNGMANEFTMALDFETRAAALCPL
jgi:hypothetical protein